MNNIIAQYLEAFGQHYPAMQVQVKPKRVRGDLKFAVLINGDAGDLLLSEDDLRSAIRMFNRGK
jgi:hypothetical protein